MKNTDFLAEALDTLFPEKWNTCSDEIETIQWKNSHITTPQEKAAILAEISKLRAEYDRNQYQRRRAPEYPSIQDQLDMQYHDAINGTTTWQDAINAVKAKYPKPE